MVCIRAGARYDATHILIFERPKFEQRSHRFVCVRKGAAVDPMVFDGDKSILNKSLFEALDESRSVRFGPAAKVIEVYNRDCLFQVYHLSVREWRPSLAVPVGGLSQTAKLANFVTNKFSRLILNAM